MILCGGSGERLWPASRPWRPKPFLPLVGPLSGFQTAVTRAAPLAQAGGLVVVAGAAHADLVNAQLKAIGAEATVLLEPAARNTAPAIAAAAGWIARRAPDARLVVMAADHHIPDSEAFQAAILTALAAAEAGAIVTLGMRPTAAVTSYGYIRPGLGEGAVKAIAGFEEKPPAPRAEQLLAEGALWNSGTFIAAADVLLEETTRWAAPVAQAAARAVDEAVAGEDGVRLGGAFASAPSIAFDRAVMERTRVGAVLPVDFAWSDLGAWDAVLAASPRDPDGNSLTSGVRLSQAQDVLVRAAPGLQVAVVGVSRVAVVAEGDAVLVCGLDQAQSVRDVAAGPAPQRHASLAAAAESFDVWLRASALPLWATVGVDAGGGFRDALTWDGQPVDPYRRTRVQARQAFVFASAAAEGLAGPWAAVARAGYDAFRAGARRPDGLFASTVDLAGAQSDPTPRLYENAFVLLAQAAMHRLDPQGGAAGEGADLREALAAFRHSAGGFREAGAEAEAYQANASMHLFEAALAWAQNGGGPGWDALADELAELALTRFIDPQTGALHEFFDAVWRPLTGEAGRIEPGHQFEWAWLLARWGALRSDPRGADAARRLFAVGRTAFDPARGVAVNALWDDLTVRDAGARLWPQTEHLKAALILGETDAALEAANGLATYLDTPARGAWRERMRADGGFIAEPSPATSLYHLYLAVRELTRRASEPC